MLDAPAHASYAFPCPPEDCFGHLAAPQLFGAAVSRRGRGACESEGRGRRQPARADALTPLTMPQGLYRTAFAATLRLRRRFAPRLLTVVASCLQQGRLLLAFLVAAGEAAVRGSPPPSLLPAAQGG
jgi:hypothetical protein